MVKKLLAPCARKKRLQRKMAEDYHLMMKKILASSLSRDIIVIALFTCLCLKDQLDLCSINCHIHAMTENCSASVRGTRCEWFLR